MADQAETDTGRLTRRHFIGWAGAGLAGVVALSFVRQRLPGGRKPVPADTPLPGQGSIFQPREDPRSRV